MMKKLLILMLVLGMASSAGAAAFSLRIDGSDPGAEHTMLVGNTIDIGIHNDTVGSSDDTRQLLAYAMILDATVSAVNPRGRWTENENLYIPPTVSGAPANTYSGIMDYTGGPDYAEVWYAELADGIGTHYTQVGLMADFEYMCTAMGDVTVKLMDGTTGGWLDSVTIHQVPEPMTILLLGLGGLFLRRRR